ncbi:MAG: MFS transporter [Vibrio sp.]
MSHSVMNNNDQQVAKAADHKPILFFLALSLVTALINSSASTPLYPYYQDRFGLSSTMLSVIYGAYAAGVIVSLLIVGQLAKRITDKRVFILPALGVVLVAGIVFCFADSFASLFVARLLTGIGTGALTGAANVSLAKIGPNDKGKTAALIAVLSFTLGLSIGPLLTGLAIHYEFYPAQAPFLVISLMACVAFLGVLKCWPRALKTVSAEKISANLSAGNIENRPVFALCAATLFLCWMVAACILTFGPSLSQRFYHGASNSNLYFSFLVTLYLLIAGISQIMCKKWTALVSVQYGYLIQILSFVIIGSAIAWSSALLACVGVILAGFAYGALFVGSARWVNQMATPANHAKSIALFYLVAYTANWVPIILGCGVDILGLTRVMLGALVVFSLVEVGLLAMISKQRVALLSSES